MLFADTGLQPLLPAICYFAIYRTNLRYYVNCRWEWEKKRFIFICKFRACSSHTEYFKILRLPVIT